MSKKCKFKVGDLVALSYRRESKKYKEITYILEIREFEDGRYISVGHSTKLGGSSLNEKDVLEYKVIL